MRDRQTEEALMLLSLVGEREIAVRDAVEIIQNVTKVPERVREILEEAEERGMIRREKGKLIIVETAKELFRAGEYPRVVKRKGEDACARCGRQITACYYIALPERELGPFGSTCIKRMKIAL